MIKLCECGCGQIVKPGNRFINGHNTRNKKRTPETMAKMIKTRKENILNPKKELESKLCACGCGDYAKPGNKFIHGHNPTNSWNKGKQHTEETKEKMRRSQIKRHKENPISDETREKLRKSNSGPTGKHLSKEHKEKLRKTQLGRITSEETRILLSCIHQGIPFDKWKGFTSEQRYCSLFNEKLKEKIRELYNRRCFICGKTEEENGQKHDVHHVNYNKNCLCNIGCEFIPLCKSCHSKTNFNRKYWEDIIMYYLYPERYFMIDI